MQTQLPDLLYRYRGGFNRIAAIAAVSQEGNVLAVNERFTEMYGHTESEIVGKPVGILKSTFTPSSIYRDLWSSVLAGNSWSGEILNAKKTGDLIWVRCTITFIGQDDSHYPDAFLVMYQDINDEVIKRKTLEDNAREELRQSLLAGTLHNIGNLQSIVTSSVASMESGSSSLLDACRLARSRSDFLLESASNLDCVLDILERQALTLKNTTEKSMDGVKRINDVLESFRDMQRNVRSVACITPLTVLRDTIEGFSYQAATLCVQVSLSIQESAVAGREVLWPAKQLHQVLYNLLKNAAEAIETERVRQPNLVGRIDIGIEVHPTQPADHVIITVRDNGGGIRLGEGQLYRSGSTTKPSGLGLGLHNASLLINSMGGAISTVGLPNWEGNKGTCFKIELPNQVSHSLTPSNASGSSQQLTFSPPKLAGSA